MFGRRPVMRGVARTAVVAGTATAVSGRVRRRQDNKWAAEEQAQYEEQAAAAPPPDPAPAPAPAPAASTDADELTKLAELHSQGVLTDEEFAAKKAQILGI